MKLNAIVGVVLVCCLLVQLSACRLPLGITKQTETVVSEVESQLNRFDESEQNSAVSELVQEIPQPWIGPQAPIQVFDSLEPYPASLDREVELTFVEPISLVELSQEIAAQIAVPISVAGDIQSAELPTINWQGSAKDALNHIASRLGYSWRAQNNRIELFHTELGMWSLFVPGVSAQWEASVGLSGSVQGGSGGSDLQANDRVVMSFDTANFWDETELAVGSLLTEYGKATINRHSGELTVVDTPVALQRVADWVAIKNQDLTTQVLVNFDLFEIHRAEDATAGFNLAGIIKKAFGNTAAAVNFRSDDSGGLVGIQLTRTAAQAVDAGDIELILRNSQGISRVAKLTSTVIRGLNNLPVPVFFGDETSYLQRRDVVNSEGTTTVRLVPGKIQDGVAINMVPRVLPDSNRLVLNLTIRTTRIKAISRFPLDAGPNDPVIQLPDLESRSVLLPVVLNSGELLFVAGLDTYRTDDSDTKAIFSKTSKAKATRTSLVLLIKPHIIRPTIDFSGQRRWRHHGGDSSIL